jgi:hypothetical protein
MDLMEMVKIIKEFFPEKAVELSETLELLRDTMDDTRQDIKKLLDLLYDQGQHDEMIPHIQLAASILEYMGRVQEVQAALELEEQVMVETGAEEEPGMPNYQAYAVDSQVVHTLHEDFTYTRPAAFEFKDNRVEVRTWQQMLIKTCEMLMALDRRFVNFENDPTMRGRKTKLFSTNPANIRSPHKLQDSELYVETNLSANSMRNLIIKMLQKYNLKPSEFKVFLRADYTSLH